MKNHGTFFLLLLLFCSLLTPGADAASKNPDKEFIAAKTALTRLDNDKGKARGYRDRWVKVVADLESFHTRYPRHQRSAEALYLAATAQEKMALISRLPGDFAAAQEAYLAVVDVAPKSSYAAEGLWAAARMTEKNLQDPAAAYRFYERIKAEQGQSNYAGKAKEELTRLAAYAPKPAPKPSVVTTPPAPSLPAVVKGERGLLNGVRSWSNPGYTRIVIDLSQPTTYTSTLLAADPAIGAPPRLFLDLLETLPIGGLPESSVVNDGLLRQIRTGKPEVGRTRVVLDLLSFDNYKIFTLPDPFRIVI
jgi:N-acetylmuramoyl-L-alanine amidase